MHDCWSAQEVRRFAAEANPGVKVARPFHPVCTLDFVLKFDGRLSASAVASGSMKELLLGLGECESPLIQKDVVDLILSLCNSQPGSSPYVIQEVCGSHVGTTVWRHVLPHLAESASNTLQISEISKFYGIKNTELFQLLTVVARTCRLAT